MGSGAAKNNSLWPPRCFSLCFSPAIEVLHTPPSHDKTESSLELLPSSPTDPALESTTAKLRAQSRSSSISASTACSPAFGLGIQTASVKARECSQPCLPRCGTGSLDETPSLITCNPDCSADWPRCAAEMRPKVPVTTSGSMRLSLSAGKLQQLANSQAKAGPVISSPRMRSPRRSPAPDSPFKLGMALMGLMGSNSGPRDHDAPTLGGNTALAQDPPSRNPPPQHTVSGPLPSPFGGFTTLAGSSHDPILRALLSDAMQQDVVLRNRLADMTFGAPGKAPSNGSTRSVRRPPKASATWSLPSTSVDRQGAECAQSAASAFRNALMRSKNLLLGPDSSSSQQQAAAPASPQVQRKSSGADVLLVIKPGSATSTHQYSNANTGAAAAIPTMAMEPNSGRPTSQPNPPAARLLGLNQAQGQGSGASPRTTIATFSLGSKHAQPETRRAPPKGRASFNIPAAVVADAAAALSPSSNLRNQMWRRRSCDRGPSSEPSAFNAGLPPSLRGMLGSKHSSLEWGGDSGIISPRGPGAGSGSPLAAAVAAVTAQQLGKVRRTRSTSALGLAAAARQQGGAGLVGKHSGASGLGYEDSPTASSAVGGSAGRLPKLLSKLSPKGWLSFGGGSPVEAVEAPAASRPRTHEGPGMGTGSGRSCSGPLNRITPLYEYALNHGEHAYTTPSSPPLLAGGVGSIPGDLVHSRSLPIPEEETAALLLCGDDDDDDELPRIPVGLVALSSVLDTLHEELTGVDGEGSASGAAAAAAAAAMYKQGSASANLPLLQAGTKHKSTRATHATAPAQNPDSRNQADAARLLYSPLPPQLHVSSGSSLAQHSGHLYQSHTQPSSASSQSVLTLTFGHSKHSDAMGTEDVSGAWSEATLLDIMLNSRHQAQQQGMSPPVPCPASCDGPTFSAAAKVDSAASAASRVKSAEQGVSPTA